ncbi:hypothetical protein FQA39_LY07002 [Lamprigera yunnana]|nr:hypothetical protein FQA39_LY07002 [Lamprigera yunnana]
MESFCRKYCVVILVICLLDISTTQQATKDHSKLGNLQSSVNKQPNPSSHLLRKKRNSHSDDIYQMDKDQFETLAEALQGYPWFDFIFNGKRTTFSFIPRLGRESGEEENQNWYRDGELNKARRSTPFSPRLGKRVYNYYFDPRLGKRNY